jgi:hypothetical protein
MRLAFALAATGLLATPAAAAPATAPAAKPTAPVPSKAAEVAAIHQTIQDTYAVISGPAGQPRDFAKMRALFAPNALLRVITPNGIRGGDLDNYIAKSGPILEKQGFTEHELRSRTEVYGNLATVWSSYDGRTQLGSFHERGINSFQLVKIDGKWLVASILWQEEGTPVVFPLPRDMLPQSTPAKKKK